MYIPIQLRFFPVLYLLYPRLLSGINVKIPGRQTMSNRKKRSTVLAAVIGMVTVKHVTPNSSVSATSEVSRESL